jgi:hypothetical protein
MKMAAQDAFGVQMPHALLKSFQNIAVPIGVFNATIVFIHAENTQH